MTYCWSEDETLKLANFPTAIWWLIRNGQNVESAFPKQFVASAINPRALFQEAGGEPSFEKIFKTLPLTQDSSLEDIGIDLFQRLKIDDVLLKELIELAQNEGLASPILLEDSVCNDCAVALPEPGLEPDVNEKTVIVGIIDDNIALAHQNFRAEKKTRFSHFWQQDASCVCYEEGDEKFSRVHFGREYNHHEIDSALSGSMVDGEIQEQDVYRILEMYNLNPGQGFKFARMTSHGTHVADLAAGIDTDGHFNSADPLNGLDPNDIKLIGVNLPTNVVADTAGTYFEISTILGISRIIEHAEAMEERWASKHPDEQPLFIPVVINISFATMNCGRNGAALLEQFMDYCVQRRVDKAPLRFVLPMGNNFLSKQVAQTTVKSGRTQTLTLRVTPDTQTSSYLQIQVRAAGVREKYSQLIANVVPPTRPAISTANGCFDPADRNQVEIDKVWLLHEFVNKKAYVKAGVFYSWLPETFSSQQTDPANRNGYETITIALPPTTSDIEGDRLPPAGDWKIALSLGDCVQNKGMEDVDIDVRVLRNDIPTKSNPSPQSARLLDECYVDREPAGKFSQNLNDPNSAITRAATINSFAGGTETIVVGALRANRFEEGAPPDSNKRILVSEYSSAGPINTPKADGSADGVTIATVSDDGYSVPGVIASGTHSGTKRRLSGTSVAAPQVTRLIAGALSDWNRSNDHSIGSLDWLKAVAKADDFGPDTPKERVGGGGISSKRPLVT